MISSKQCNEYLDELINQGLLQYNQIKGDYTSTTKGTNHVIDYVILSPTNTT
jgi:predicted transcriptional regulator